METCGYEIDEFIEEIGSGRTNSERPMFLELQKQLRADDLVLVTSLDRLGRSLVELAPLIQEFKRRGITLISLRENYDFTSAQGELMFNLLTSLAGYERELILERQKLGVERAKLAGK